MADLTELPIVGDWRIVIQSKDAAFQQRVVVSGAATNGIVPGLPGNTFDVFGAGDAPWILAIEHQDATGAWSRSFVRLGARTVNGARIDQVVESEDVTGPGSDRDFNDLVVRLEKIGMVEQTIAPFAIWPGTLQAMPEGVFETSLGRHFMAVRVRNIWGQAWPATAAVGLTDRSRAWLQQSGVTVVDGWSSDDQATFGQRVSDGRVQVGALAAGAETTIYFKVDVTAATPRKHLVEVQVFSPNEPLSHLHPRARAPIMVMRTSFDPTTNRWTSECDRGRLSVRLRGVAADYNTLRRALGRVRELFRKRPPPGHGDKKRPCDAVDREQLKQRLRDFLAGRDTDLCGIMRDIDKCCQTPQKPEDPRGTWTGRGVSGMEFVAFPTAFDYTVQYAAPFAGQFGPIPYDDPWWKVVLLVVAILLTLATVVSAAADIANHSDDVVIGEVERTVLDAPATRPPAPANSQVRGSIDAAVVRLNGNRGRTPSFFSYLDAASDEVNTVPVVASGGHIDTTGATMTNAEIDNAIMNMAAFPEALQVFKSGARTGLTRAIISSILPIAPRADPAFFINQVQLIPDPAFPADRALPGRPGDSGSLVLQANTRKIAGLFHAAGLDNSGAWVGTMCRIEDVIAKLGIHFG